MVGGAFSASPSQPTRSSSGNSTLFSHSQRRSADHADAVHFTLGGVEHSISYWELATALRLNSPHPSEHPLIVEVADPTTFGDQAYFERICLFEYAAERYIASQTRATLLRPEWQILNHLLTQYYTPSRGLANGVTHRTLNFMHAMGRSEDTIELGSVIARTFTKACASQDRYLVCDPVITALSRYYGVDTTGMTLVGAATPFSEATLRHQHMLAREGRLAWIAGLPRPPVPDPVGDDQPESSFAGGASWPRHPVRSTQATTGPSSAAPGSYTPAVSIVDQLAASAQQNERILAIQESIHTRLDRARDRDRRLMSGKHYIMSYLGLDSNSVHYPFVQSPGG
ncbi:unnamed protein product [Linum trigynum]|uniref:Uncharacterized protein n=1 Tax=Linum trigynum TaxID=586398 RepID=A0AAV2E0R2_9ROSI